MNERRRFSVEEKYAILEEARQPGVNIAEICRRHGISSSMFYRWEAQRRAGAMKALADKSGHKKNAANAETERLRAELAKKNTVIAELTEALIQEKKGLSDYLRTNESRQR